MTPTYSQDIVIPRGPYAHYIPHTLVPLHFMGGKTGQQTLSKNVSNDVNSFADGMITPDSLIGAIKIAPSQVKQGVSDHYNRKHQESTGYTPL